MSKGGSGSGSSSAAGVTTIGFGQPSSSATSASASSSSGSSKVNASAASSNCTSSKANVFGFATTASAAAAPVAEVNTLQVLQIYTIIHWLWLIFSHFLLLSPCTLICVGEAQEETSGGGRQQHSSRCQKVKLILFDQLACLCQGSRHVLPPSRIFLM